MKKFGRTVAAATNGDYLVNLDLWTIIPEIIDCLTTNASIEFFQLSGFLKWQKWVPLFIDDSPIWESGNQDFQVEITLLRPKDEFHCYLSSGSWHLGHHRIVAYGKQKYSFVPHSHATLALLCFWTFVLFI